MANKLRPGMACVEHERVTHPMRPRKQVNGDSSPAGCPRRRVVHRSLQAASVLRLYPQLHVSPRTASAEHGSAEQQQCSDHLCILKYCSARATVHAA